MKKPIMRSFLRLSLYKGAMGFHQDFLEINLLVVSDRREV